MVHACFNSTMKTCKNIVPWPLRKCTCLDDTDHHHRHLTTTAPNARAIILTRTNHHHHKHTSFTYPNITPHTQPNFPIPHLLVLPIPLNTRTFQWKAYTPPFTSHFPLTHIIHTSPSSPNTPHLPSIGSLTPLTPFSNKTPLKDPPWDSPHYPHPPTSSHYQDHPSNKQLLFCTIQVEDNTHRFIQC